MCLILICTKINAYGLLIGPTEQLEPRATQSFIGGVRDDVRNALLLTMYSNTREALGKALELKPHTRFSLLIGTSEKCAECKSTKKTR